MIRLCTAFQSGVSVPVTAKLSKRFYEQLGDDVATELVNWFNAVDTDYRGQLERMNDLNWERFKGQLSAIAASMHAELQNEIGKLRAEMYAELGKLRSEMHAELGKFRAEMHAELGNLRSEMHVALTNQNRMLFGYWFTTMLALAGIFLQLTKR